MASNDTFPLMDLTEQSSAASDLTLPMLRTPSPPPIVRQHDFDYVVYMDDLTDIQKSWSEDRAFIPATTVYSLTFVIGILGNCFVIFALLGGWRVGRTNEGLSIVIRSFFRSRQHFAFHPTVSCQSVFVASVTAIARREDNVSGRVSGVCHECATKIIRDR